jgi:hypothetical protein
LLSPRSLFITQVAGQIKIRKRILFSTSVGTSSYNSKNSIIVLEDSEHLLQNMILSLSMFTVIHSYASFICD